MDGGDGDGDGDGGGDGDGVGHLNHSKSSKSPLIIRRPMITLC